MTEQSNANLFNFGKGQLKTKKTNEKDRNKMKVE